MTRKNNLNAPKNGKIHISYKKNMWLVKTLAGMAFFCIVFGMALIFASSSFKCSRKSVGECDNGCMVSCDKTCFCTSPNHSSATAAVFVLLAGMALALVMIGCLVEAFISDERSEYPSETEDEVQMDQIPGQRSEPEYP